MVQVLLKYQLDKNAYHSNTAICQQNYQLSTNAYRADAGCNEDETFYQGPPLYQIYISIFCRGDSGLATNSPCGGWHYLW